MNEYPKIVYYYADKKFFDNLVDRHGEDLSESYHTIIRKLNYCWFDLCSYLKENKFVAKGLFDYKLKNIVSVLNLCEYGDMVNGKHAFEVAINHYTQKEDEKGMKMIEEYNGIDCLALEVIYKFLKCNI